MSAVTGDTSIVMVGLMGTGKTTAALGVSQRLSLPMSDSDSFLGERYGVSAANTAATQGAAVLHEREAEHVLTALAGPRQVIAAAASIVEDARVRRALRPPFVVWLDAPDSVLVQRMRSGAHRPDFDPATLRARRAPYFAEVADLTVNVATHTPRQTVDLILGALPSS